MKIVILTNDNFFSFSVLKNFLERRREEIELVVFSTALIGKRRAWGSIKWSLKNTGFRHTVFKLMVYGIFRMMRIICKFFPFIRNHYSSRLWFERNGINRIDTSDINSPEITEQIRRANPDLVVSVSMNQVVKKEILQIPSRGSINVHCAPLPRYGGMSPYVWALANNEDYSATTIHYIEEGLDEGDIIVQEKVDVVKGDSAFSLFYRCCLRARALLPKVVDEIEAGTATCYEQDLSKKTYFSWPTKECVKQLHANGYSLAKVMDFVRAIFKQEVHAK